MSVARDFSFVIVGGGVLGSALAALAAAAGLDPLVLRRSDAGSPYADTLRNQGWLQSGIMYQIKQFKNEQAYAVFAERTYFAGRELLAMCGLPVPDGCGLLGVGDDFNFNQLKRKRELLRLSDSEFRQLGDEEAKREMQSHYEQGRTYYRIPDAPFDEAAVVAHFRHEGTAQGAVFIEVDEPVQLKLAGDRVKICFEGREVTSPTVVITAGAGSFELMKQCGVALAGDLQRTPLVVGEAPDDMPASIVVDLGRGFSAVRHNRGYGFTDAVVMGTRTKKHPAPDPAERLVPRADQEEFATYVPPGFLRSVERGRYTAGYEVIPKRGGGLTAFEPWVQPEGPLIFGSPGRATVSALAAKSLLAEVIERRALEPHLPKRTTKVDLTGCKLWSCPVEMHYMPSYSYNDGEE